MKNYSLMVIIMIALAGCGVPDDFAQGQKKAHKPFTMVDLDTSDNQDIIREAKNYFKETALDPDSLKFRAIRVRRHVEDNTRTVCGQINGKNTYGGFTGFQLFFYNDNGQGGVPREGEDNIWENTQNVVNKAVYSNVCLR